MLEGLVAWVLNNYLGKYVENLNTAQLSVALLTGEVELENLPLKKDALRHLGFPVQIKAGFIGKIKLQIPVRQIKSAPWVVQIEQLFLVATPLPVQEWDDETERLIAHEEKLSALDDLEARWRLENDTKDNSTYYASSYSSWLNYGTGFITDIIENLQLKIRDVHIRYEDHISIPHRNVACGITMESFSAQSADDNWQPGFSHWNRSNASFKLLEMQKLAVYWMEVGEDELLAQTDITQLASAMSTSGEYKYAAHCILQPVSAQAKVKQSRCEQPLRSDEPRITCDLELEEVPMVLVDWQHDQIIKCIKGLDDVHRYRRYRKYRPPCTVKEDARAWWMYAISCMYPGRQPDICKPKFTLLEVLDRWKTNLRYVSIYNKTLITPTVVLPPEEKSLKDDVEWSRDFDELKVLREIAMKSIPLQNRGSTWSNSAGGSTLVRWFPQWMGWYCAPPPDNAPPQEPTQLEGEILQVLSDSVDNNTLLKRDAVFGKFSFTLKSGTLSLCTTLEDTKDSFTMLELQFKTFFLNIVSKPRTSSYSVELSLGALFLFDKVTPKTLFPILIGPPGNDRNIGMRARGPSPRVSVASKPDAYIFHMVYEKKLEANQYRLSVKTNSLDVVYQPTAMRWLIEFLCLPHQRQITHQQIEAMKTRTKRELFKNWEQIMDTRMSARKCWELQLDISAPQIFFVEQFHDPNSAVAVIDFGRLQLRNNYDHPEISVVSPRPDDAVGKVEDDDDMFMTPCSTPPASEESDLESDLHRMSKDLGENINWNLNEALLHNKIYDRYTVELTDMQILVARVKDNWRYAHNKGTSTLHVLDRFNISLQIERRVVHTYDPSYPNLTLNANLPKLVAHVNEHKISAARKLAQIITATGLPSPFNSPSTTMEPEVVVSNDDDDTLSMETSMELSRLLILQFTVDHLALEVQSRGRSVAELQVAGVKFGFTKRPSDLNLTLSVHSLLLVDALQTFGPDFELLIASHKHVGMDSMSGSLRDSEPTSPTSPGSPDHCRVNATSPVALTLALSSLATSPPPNQAWNNRIVLDQEALISLDLILVFGVEAMQIANIQFNNLDIIANQETIVELMGFIRRVFPDMKSQKPCNHLKPIVSESVQSSVESFDNIDGHEDESTPNIGTTEITFDFHRLNVLLLRGVVKDGQVVGKKICTSTMSDARIQATVSKKVTIEGSLGGLQVHDLTPDGYMHQRIVSVGRDPLMETIHPLYLIANNVIPEENTAFSFKIVRTLQTNQKDKADIKIRMASLWYTHSPHFVMELQSCATEFKQYMANLARSIRVAATDMALGLVHARAEALAQSIYMNSRLSASIYGSALSFTEVASPRKRRRSSSMEYSFSGYSSVRDTTCPQTPYTPMDDGNFKIDIELDIVLDSPVVVLPRTASSTQVFVAHLGKITVNNNRSQEMGKDYVNGDSYMEPYYIEIRDMNIFSLETATRRVPGPLNARPEILYACDTLAKPILHDTIIELRINREIFYKDACTQQSLSNLLLDDDDDDGDPLSDSQNYQEKENVEVTGIVVNALKISLTRAQYEQLLDTLQWLTVTQEKYDNPATKNPISNLADITEEDTGVTTLNMDPQVRAKLFSNVPINRPTTTDTRFVSAKVIFELPDFTIELRGDSPTGEQGLVDLSFRDFNFTYDRGHLYETNIHVSLRSIYMEDLLQPEGSKQRAMVISSNDEIPAGANCVSRSCPDICLNSVHGGSVRGSLPDHLEAFSGMGVNRSHSIHKEVPQMATNMCPNTPPPSPSRTRPVRNLVLISTLLVDPKVPNFATNYNSVQRSTSVDFNCLDLVINVESWVVVIDFFSATPSETASKQNRRLQSQKDSTNLDTIEQTNITVRSLTVVLVKPDRDIGKANISNVEISVLKKSRRKEVEGKLGSMSLLDLTAHGAIYRERFMTSGKQALTFKYVRHGSEEITDYDSQLTLDMSSVIYVHTKRFVVELQSFFYHFTQLQTIMAGIRAATSGQIINDEQQRFSIILTAQSPVIVLPVSSKSSQLIIVDLEHLKVTNCFKFNDEEGTISVQSNLNQSKRKCLLDVMHLDLKNVNLQAGEATTDMNTPGIEYRLGNYSIRRMGDSLLRNKCHLKIQVERNLNSNVCHNVPDMSIHGELSTLDGTLDLNQYKLVRGFLAHNLGENTEHILPSVQAPFVTAESNIREVWTLSSLRLDLLNVTVRLQQSKNTGPLACINFIKSRLTVEAFSNMSQDIDLVSQEILILDTRSADTPRSRCSNVFTNILEPIKLAKQENLVQVEIHSRQRRDHSKFTILLNNMRLMAVFEWWAMAKEFIFQDIDEEPASPSRRKTLPSGSKEVEAETVPFELKLNITDSEVVVLEDTSMLETNAVILKSTTVITYRSALVDKPLSCNLNNCEVYSCVFDKAEETALSIVDPVTLNMEINKDRVLDIQLSTLTVRLSYFDMMMFMQILNSLPNQLFSSRTKETHSDLNQKMVDKLKSLGFNEDDCVVALRETKHKLDDAALWLTQNALPKDDAANGSSVHVVELKANKIFLCIIDDCGDSDVPLLEMALSSLYLRQDLGFQEHEYKGALECVLSGDYYNRVLSGWEPIIEPWRCLITWGHALSQNLSKTRLEVVVESKDILNVNVTSTFIELYGQVRDSWMQDFYSPINRNQVRRDKRRSPFVPYAIKNETGSPLYYNTLIAAVSDGSYNAVKQNESERQLVLPGEEAQFSFKTRDKIRHSDTHKMRLHQLAVQICGYESITPVTVDKVGVYFRQVQPQQQSSDVPMARIVLDVSLAGFAKKLVTVRSALQLVNKLTDTIELKVESSLPHDSVTLWSPSKVFRVESDSILYVPIVHTHSLIKVRPVVQNQKFTYCSPPIEWEQMARSSGNGVAHDIKNCHTHRGLIYKFCTEIKRENYPKDRSSQRAQPAHTITLLPSILLVNLLPQDLLYCIGTVKGRIFGGSQTALSSVDAENNVEIKLHLDNFPMSNALIVPSGTNSFTCRIRLEDSNSRKMFLMAQVTPHTDAKIKITITSPFWIINKTGLPLVFRQHGVSQDAAGQFSEHEVARMVAPLLFSFSDPAASNTVTARVGTNVASNGSPQWCQNFHLQRGVQVRKIRVSLRDNRPDVVFLVGIEIRQGRGKYRNTSIVTISPRYQLHNRSSYKLQFAQQCFALKMDEINYIKAMPNANMPFHWPRPDQELLLCVKILDISDCQWSGGLKIDANYSMHVNVRNVNGRMYFLRLEVVQQGATYFVIFTDADTMPPPIRIDNFSEVAMKFAQTCCKESLTSVARAHSSVPYAWDQPTKQCLLTIEAPGGISHTYDITKFGTAPQLTYENFIYIAFSATFRALSDMHDCTMGNQELVLEVDANKRVILARKEQGCRSQLWRMSSTGQLQHEGSSPPSHPNQVRRDNILVLDIEGTAPQPNTYTRLALRRPDPRRKSTQTWRFTEEGRLCCVHHNMCVQAQDGFFGLRQGNSAVLGLPQPICHRTTDTGVPVEQAVERQRLRPGSGILEIEVTSDGPTKVLSIWDKKERNKNKQDLGHALDIFLKQRPIFRHADDDDDKPNEYQLNVRLQGLGVSLVSAKPAQELLYALFSNIIAEVVTTAKSKRLCVSIKDIQIDNQLFEAPTSNFLFVTPSKGTVDAQSKLSALEVLVEMQPIVNQNAVIFDHLIVRLKKLTILLEERLLLKLFEFIGYRTKDEEVHQNVENDYETQRIVIDVTAAHAKRYYFGIIQLVPDQIRLSMVTATKLPQSLQQIKRKAGLTFIKFEDAGVDLEPYVRQHSFETIQVLVHSIVQHFKDELIWQAGIILGSVDFLGNPLGFMNDVTEGVSGLIYEGNIGALVKNVTHGISNSAAKVTESISDGLGKVTMDEEHEELRQKIRQNVYGSSSGHLLAGIKGFGVGMLGGATGIFKQIYEGASNEGIPGVFSGIGKGIVGAVTKPVVGVLDLASETARAVRDSSRSRQTPDQLRSPRCAVGPGGLLPRYSVKQSHGQQNLYVLNDRKYSEMLVAYETLRSGTEDLRVIITNLRICIVTSANAPLLTTVIESPLSELEECGIIQQPDNGGVSYIELIVRLNGATHSSLPYQDAVRRPKVRCDSYEVAKLVTRQINYAKRLYDERKMTLTSDNISQSED